MTPLPAASLTACLAWSSRPLYSKLRRGGRKRGGGGGEVWGSTRPTCPTGGRGRGPCGALWGLASCGLCVDEDGRETEARVYDGGSRVCLCIDRRVV